MPDIKLGSLFDGIGVFPLAASRCGIRPVWASEIEKAPISISGKCLLVMEMGAFSISLAQTGRIPHREAARGNTPIPSKRLPSLMSGMARGAVSLHGKHPFQDVYKRQLQYA